MRKGFTLVELSIVLVIIGLLVGGVLIAQSMISTARMQMLIKTFEQYEIATHNFYNVIKYYPGDVVYAGDYFSNSTIGNVASPFQWGDGYITYHHAGGNETLFFFPDLYSMKMVDKEYKYIAAPMDTSSAGLNTWAPAFPRLPDNGFIRADSTTDGYNPISNFDSTLEHCKVAFHAVKQASNNEYTGGYLTPANMKALDSKIDDGKPDRGKILSDNAHSSSGCFNTGQWNFLNSAPYDGTRDYNMPATDLACKPIYCIDETLFNKR